MNNEGLLALLEIPEILATQSVHGNAFLKIELSPILQVHIWHDALPAQNTSSKIHDHNFSFTSIVKSGTLIQTVIAAVANGIGEYHMYKGGKTLTKMSDMLYQPTVLTTEALAAGSVYEMKAGDWHDATAVGTTITVMNKSLPSIDDTHVLVHQSTEPDNDFDRHDQIIPSCVLEDVRRILRGG